MPDINITLPFAGADWTRRTWLTTHAAILASAALPERAVAARNAYQSPRPSPELRERAAHQARSIDTAAWEALAARAVAAAVAAGAQYADARLTRTVSQNYEFKAATYYDSAWDLSDQARMPLRLEKELTAVGVRVLVGGYWGFCAEPHADADVVVRLARSAVAQARTNAKGSPRVVDLGRVPPAVGRWATPVEIDPFAMTIEEKWDTMAAWYTMAARVGIPIDTGASAIGLWRQEQVVASSDGARFTQTLYETGATIRFFREDDAPKVSGIDAARMGWERLTRADIPAQLQSMPARAAAYYGNRKTAKVALVGRKTIVCDGATMAAMVEHTFGTATQLDRALGYEANASGTSAFDDPLAMLGTLQVAAPVITLNANRSIPGQLATVKWDDEGVEPLPFTLVNNGVLTDYQTTREQAAWLAPYYEKAGHAIRSHGCAASDTALGIALQRVPNLALAPNPAATSLEDLIASVPDGVLVGGAKVYPDFQGRTGLIDGELTEIRNGRLGRPLSGGAVLYNTSEFWKKVSVIGSQNTVMGVSVSSEKGNPRNGCGTPSRHPRQ